MRRTFSISSRVVSSCSGGFPILPMISCPVFVVFGVVVVVYVAHIVLVVVGRMTWL